MAQADGNIANQAGAAFRTDLNNQLLALFTQHSGNAAPSSPQPFQPWIDSSTSPATWKVRNSTNTAWITVGTINSTTNTFAVGGVTAIASGGTGQTTASGAINALVPSQTGNSGKALISNGTSVSWGSAGAASRTEIFTSSTTWVCPDGVTYVTAVVVGGGGGGAQYSNGNGGDGGVGGVGIGCISVTPGTQYSVNVGLGGAGSNTTNGSAGGSSVFSTITATGGTGGVGNTDGTNGTCTSTAANLKRGNVGTTIIPYLTVMATSSGIVYSRANAGSATASIAWVPDAAYCPGSGGTGELALANNATGGVAGAILLMY